MRDAGRPRGVTESSFARLLFREDRYGVRHDGAIKASDDPGSTTWRTPAVVTLSLAQPGTLAIVASDEAGQMMLARTSAPGEFRCERGVASLQHARWAVGSAEWFVGVVRTTTTVEFRRLGANLLVTERIRMTGLVLIIPMWTTQEYWYRFVPVDAQS